MGTQELDHGVRVAPTACAVTSEIVPGVDPAAQKLRCRAKHLSCAPHRLPSHARGRWFVVAVRRPSLGQIHPRAQLGHAHRCRRLDPAMRAPSASPASLVAYVQCGAISPPCSSSPSARVADRAHTPRRRGRWCCSSSSRSCWPPRSTTARLTPRSVRRGSCASPGRGGRGSSRCPAAGRGDD
jgi:hypothetical protein